MEIELRDRTSDHVRVYFERTRDAEVQKYLPQTVTTLRQALDNFEIAQKPNATSYGRTIYVDGTYVGDIWCYAIDGSQIPHAMVSYCIFEKCCWGKGIMTSALEMFLSEVQHRYGISCFGAFSYLDNTASVCVLKKNEFRFVETFSENGVSSVYMQKDNIDEI